jgi:hypothetical protein
VSSCPPSQSAPCAAASPQRCHTTAAADHSLHSHKLPACQQDQVLPAWQELQRAPGWEVRWVV